MTEQNTKEIEAQVVKKLKIPITLGIILSITLTFAQVTIEKRLEKLETINKAIVDSETKKAEEIKKNR